MSSSIDWAPGVACGGRLSQEEVTRRSLLCTKEQLNALMNSSDFKKRISGDPKPSASSCAAVLVLLMALIATSTYILPYSPSQGKERSNADFAIPQDEAELSSPAELLFERMQWMDSKVKNVSKERDSMASKLRLTRKALNDSLLQLAYVDEAANRCQAEAAFTSSRLVSTMDVLDARVRERYALVTAKKKAETNLALCKNDTAKLQLQRSEERRAAQVHAEELTQEVQKLSGILAAMPRHAPLFPHTWALAWFSALTSTGGIATSLLVLAACVWQIAGPARVSAARSSGEACPPTTSSVWTSTEGVTLRAAETQTDSVPAALPAAPSRAASVLSPMVRLLKGFDTRAIMPSPQAMPAGPKLSPELQVSPARAGMSDSAMEGATPKTASRGDAATPTSRTPLAAVPEPNVQPYEGLCSGDGALLAHANGTDGAQLTPASPSTPRLVPEEASAEAEEGEVENDENRPPALLDVLSPEVAFAHQPKIARTPCSSTATAGSRQRCGAADGREVSLPGSAAASARGAPTPSVGGTPHDPQPMRWTPARLQGSDSPSVHLQRALQLDLDVEQLGAEASAPASWSPTSIPEELRCPDQLVQELVKDEQQCHQAGVELVRRSALASLLEQADGIYSALAHTDSQLRVSQQDNNTLRKKFADMEGWYNTLQKDLQDAEGTLYERGAELKQLMEEKAALGAKLMEQQKEKAALEAKLAEQQKEMAVLEGRNVALRAELDARWQRLQAQAKQLKSERDLKQQELERLTAAMSEKLEAVERAWLQAGQGRLHGRQHQESAAAARGENAAEERTAVPSGSSGACGIATALSSATAPSDGSRKRGGCSDANLQSIAAAGLQALAGQSDTQENTPPNAAATPSTAHAGRRALEEQPGPPQQASAAEGSPATPWRTTASAYGRYFRLATKKLGGRS